MKPYRLKHVPTGLYYKPGEVNLTKNGKVYQAEASALTYYSYNYLFVSVRNGSKIHKATEGLIDWQPQRFAPDFVQAKIPKNQFIKEEI